jgi:hypothetical protein
MSEYRNGVPRWDWDRHGQIMVDLVLDGLDREAASRCAFDMMRDQSLLLRVYAELGTHRSAMAQLLGISGSRTRG